MANLLDHIKNTSEEVNILASDWELEHLGLKRKPIDPDALKRVLIKLDKQRADILIRARAEGIEVS